MTSQKKTPDSQMRASMNYQKNALEKISTIYVTDNELYTALQAIKEHHGGNKAGAVKQAIIEYAKLIAK